MEKIQLENGKTVSASQYGESVELADVGELTATEQEMAQKLKVK